MTKSQLIEIIGQRVPAMPGRSVEAVVNTVFGAMAGALANGERIEIRGFGIFGIKVRPAKLGRNPKTGAKVQVPERKSPFFVVGKDLKDRLNRSPAHASSGSDGLGASDAAPVAMAAAPRSTL